MTKCLYFRLAVNNLRKNKQTYLPFLLASTLLTFTLYSFLMITFNPGMASMHGGAQFLIILNFGIFVVGLFTAIFLFYANGFLIKRRKKEMGLYSILGMEKKHIARVLMHELSLTWWMSMLLGLGAGVLLSRLLFLLIQLAIHVEVPLSGALNPQALIATLLAFAALFTLLFLYNAFQVRIVSPMELLRGSQTGEREPKARFILAVLGVACTGAGYWLAQSVDNPMAAMALFFIAVLLVIVGTYLLFLCGSIALLKMLKRSKRYYYRSQHFITVSGMLYRMKQNAAGLASIAILCTMAMITLGTTTALYMGSEKMLNVYYPYDALVTSEDVETQADIQPLNERLAAQTGVTLSQFNAYHGYNPLLVLDEGTLYPSDYIEDSSVNDYDKLQDTLIITNDMFAQMQGAPLALAPGELGCYNDAEELTGMVTIGGTVYPLQTIQTLPFKLDTNGGTIIHQTVLVAADEAGAAAIAAALNAADTMAYITQWDVDGSSEQVKAYYALLHSDTIWGETGLRLKAEQWQDWYTMYGGLLFVGIFLGLVFLMGSAMIIYFKQISEGYQDHDRFIIMQKVGMSPQEVRRTVGSQILLVFFLPLLVAVCHVAGSLHMMVLMLRIFGLTDVPYIALNTFMSAFIIMALYGLFYLKTAKTYYKMVKF